MIILTALNVGWSLTEQNTFLKNNSCDTITSTIHRNVPANSNSGHFTKMFLTSQLGVDPHSWNWLIYKIHSQCFLLCAVFRLSFLFLLFFSPPSPSSTPLAPSFPAFIFFPPSILETNVYEYFMSIFYMSDWIMHAPSPSSICLLPCIL